MPARPDNPFAHGTLRPLRHRSMFCVADCSIWVNLPPVAPEMPPLPNPVHFSNSGSFARLLSTRTCLAGIRWFPHSTETGVCVHCAVHPARSAVLCSLEYGSWCRPDCTPRGNVDFVHLLGAVYHRFVARDCSAIPLHTLHPFPHGSSLAF